MTCPDCVAMVSKPQNLNFMTKRVAILMKVSRGVTNLTYRSVLNTYTIFAKQCRTLQELS